MEQKKSKILLVLIGLLFPLSQSGARSTLVVEMKNGQSKEFKLSEKPVLTMSGTKLLIKTNSVNTDLERSEIGRFYFTETTGIKAVNTNSLTFTQINAEELRIENLEGCERVTVYNLSGHVVDNCVIHNGETTATVSLKNCPKGIYIIKVGNIQTIKITKR